MEELEAVLGFDPLTEPPSVESSRGVRRRDQWEWWASESRAHREQCRRLSTLVLTASNREGGEDPPALVASWCESVSPKGSSLGPAAELRLPLFPTPAQLPSRDPEWLRREITTALGVWLSHIGWAIAGAGPEGGMAVRDAFETVTGVRPVFDAEGRLDHTADTVGLTWIDHVAYSFVESVEDRSAESDTWGSS